MDCGCPIYTARWRAGERADDVCRGDAPYTQGEGYQAVALPYKGDRAEMIVLLPDAGRFTDFEQSSTGKRSNESCRATIHRRKALPAQIHFLLPQI
jgi:serine protease inhibitor